MPNTNADFTPNDRVRHQQFGIGTVVVDQGDSVIVRFERGLEECLRPALQPLVGVPSALVQETWAPPLEVLTRVQAEAIRSINDTWGVFSRSRIALLPHQLWVCKKVLERWPARWLVADDVGLGKTIEAGLILWPLIARGRVKRLLVLCPAGLVANWQYRLRTMFDIRLAQYTSAADTQRGDFFATHDQVVASLDTLSLWLSDKEARHREHRKARRDRFDEAPPWDMLIVDEAHHLNSDEDSGPTLAYRLVQELVDQERVESVVFFTGTPHRGKNFGFLSLCSLLRPDLFDIREPAEGQLHNLRHLMIRNNKHSVTDLEGHRLFQQPTVRDETYAYSQQEAEFYDLMTGFILSGKAYASELQAREGRAVMLVLVAMQKLASSSVAAIRRAIRKRLDALRTTELDLQKKQTTYGHYLSEYEEASIDPSGIDRLNELEEDIARLTARLLLMRDEAPRLEQLLAAANAVTAETKIARLIGIVRQHYPDRQVLFFTEYKATQSLVMSALSQEFGRDCVTFINGDEQADDVVDASGMSRTMRETRERAAERFNRGNVRFLVSTEAGGEGIDLQESCHTLVHVDLPWNPMRMHQRVGRLNRYGQQERVEVAILRNPDTVESRVWMKLNEKIQAINEALGQVMDEPEDLLELILGMASPSLYRDLYTGAAGQSAEAFGAWFDRQTATFGGKDALDTVKALVGNTERFDFQTASSKIPRVDLPDLRSFFVSMLALNRRRVTIDGGGISFKTPETWSQGVRMPSEYTDMIFDRHDRSERSNERLLAVGHPLVNAAIAQARNIEAAITTIATESLPGPLFIFTISDRITSGGLFVRSTAAGMLLQPAGDWTLLPDWELLRLINSLADEYRGRRSEREAQAQAAATVASYLQQASERLQARLPELDLPFELPDTQPISILWPQGWHGALPV
jgi:superfamily II DNA or RNA helicase